MGWSRRALRAENMQCSGTQYSIVFRHPLTKKTTRCMLGRAGEEFRNLARLNEIFLSPERWHHLPADTPDCVRLAWCGVVDQELAEHRNVEQGEIQDATVFPRPANAELAQLVTRLRRQNTIYRRRLEALTGRKERDGAVPTLQEAMEEFLRRYTGYDVDHTKGVRNDLRRFVAEFGPKTVVDRLDGREADFRAWLNGLIAAHGPRAGKPLSAGRRNQMRTYIVAMLEAAGQLIDKKAWPAASVDELRRDRGAIRWCSREQAERLAEALEDYWADCWRLQVLCGFRPDELITLSREDLSDDGSQLTLSEKKHLTLKRGSNTIQLPVAAREIILRRTAKLKMVFPHPETGGVWPAAKSFDKRYLYALRFAQLAVNDTIEAAVDAGALSEDAARLRIDMPLDARIGRRTFGSLMLREGWSAEKLAAYMRTGTKMIHDHYAAILSEEIDRK